MKKYDIIVLGMGPAGMAVTAMGSSMGLNVLAIESNKVGGECLNVGCIPSKGILKAGESLHIAKNTNKYGLDGEYKLNGGDPLKLIREKVGNINNKKFLKTFEKADIIINRGFGKFVNSKTIKVDGEEYTAKKIFIATGTEPFIPPIPGLKEVSKLTNVNLFDQENVPESLTVIGGGAIGSEMAQAFSRLGSKVTIVQMDSHLIPNGDKDAGLLLEKALTEEGIEIYNSTKIEKVEEINGKVITYTDKGIFESEKILVATGRKPVLDSLDLDKAGIICSSKGIEVDSKLRTNKKHIYAVGDINGIAQLSHAAMHQGMMALMDTISPISIKKLKHKNYVLPWSVFTSPEIAQAGLTEKEATEKGIKFEITQKEYSSYGLTVAVGKPEGFIKIIHTPMGKVLGATIAGENASELIHEWVLAIQNNIKMYDIMMTQHSFPSFSMLNKMVTEDWMMKKMENKGLQKLIKWLF